MEKPYNQLYHSFKDKTEPENCHGVLLGWGQGGIYQSSINCFEIIALL